MFGEGASGKLLEKWTTAFKKKVIQQCKKLPTTSDVGELLLAAESPSDDSEDCVNFGKMFKIIKKNNSIFSLVPINVFNIYSSLSIFFIDEILLT